MCVRSGKILGKLWVCSCEPAFPKRKVSLCLPAHTMLKLGEINTRTQYNGGKVFLSTAFQTTLKYNVHLEKQESAFALRVQTVPLTCDNPEGHNSFQISLEIRYEPPSSLSLSYYSVVFPELFIE